jgi:hypothetical protein
MNQQNKDQNNSAIFQVPKLSQSQLEDKSYLRKQVIKSSEKLSRYNRQNLIDHKKSVRLLENDVVTAKSLVSPLEVNTNPAVLGAMYRLNQAKDELKELISEHSTNGYLKKISTIRKYNMTNKRSVSKSIILEWNGPKSTARNENSVWSESLGGQVDRSLCQVVLVKHKRHWDPTNNTRGLCDVGKRVVSNSKTRDPLYYVQEAVTMQSPQRLRQSRESNPLLDATPSAKHGSEQYVRSLVPKRTKKHKELEKNFKYGKLVADIIPEADIDHKCFGTPFATQQVVRTILDRTIEKLQKELKQYPLHGMTAEKQKPKAAVEMALGEFSRVRKHMTGKRAAELEKRVAEAKKRVKNKLAMMGALKNKGYGDFSFLQKIKALQDNSTPRTNS